MEYLETKNSEEQERENERLVLERKRLEIKEKDAIVYSLISGPQTFSDFFYKMKVCEETVLCN